MKYKSLLVIPIMIFAYLLFANTVPFGAVTNYYIDIGNNDTQGVAKFNGPFDRISEPKEIDNVTMRELKDSPVYFSLKNPYMIKNRERITVDIIFAGDFPREQKLIIGAKNNDVWSYKWKDAYNPLGETIKNVDKWKKGNVSWNIDELDTRYSTLSFAINVPHLNKEIFRNYTIFIDMINIKIETPPIWDRIWYNNDTER